jgi:hypothetical protein
VAHHNDPNLFYRGALQSLCTPCHSGRKQSLEARERLIEERGYSLDIGSDGYPLDPRHPVYRQ